ncbi:uncharacterized protein K441DRAFT_580558, partial [Cenococcum geophilum 1.58]|uniref:uncharacterized protein n=1 Tax=Cenococcum geophilum 1.58 TaxID=794803 RepID=UPI00358F5CAA
VIVIDNCRTHHVAVTYNEFYVLLLYLPPYLPNYNPIELSFYLLKQWQRRHASIAPIYGEDQYIKKFKAFLFALVREFSYRVNW